MPPPSECVGLATGRLLATTPRRARVLDLSAYKPTLPRAALQTLAAAAPALTVLMLGACSDQEIESVATVFGERLTEFATKGSMDITDGATVALCKYCPRLQILKLGDSPFLTDRDVGPARRQGRAAQARRIQRQLHTILGCETGNRYAGGTVSTSERTVARTATRPFREHLLWSFWEYG